MTLYYSHASPYARTCRVMLREKNLLHSISETEVNPLADPVELIAHNPLGKIPCLVLAGLSGSVGAALFDSVVINDYLNQTGSGPDLFAAHQTSWPVKTFQAASQGLLDVAVQLRIEKTKPEGTQSYIWMERNHNAILRTARYFQDALPQFPTEPNFLPLHLAVALGYLDFRHGDIDWRSKAPLLSQWYSELCARPSLIETEPR